MPKLYEALAEAFRAEDVDTQFVLMGDGNMHWATAFSKLPDVHTVHVRHEHVTVAAATAYNIATNKVAAATVACSCLTWTVSTPGSLAKAVDQCMLPSPIRTNCVSTHSARKASARAS